LEASSVALVRKALIVRIGFRVDEHSGDNHILSTFINHQKKWIERNFKIEHISHGGLEKKT